ncbi:MAG: hypothetical protein HRF46_09270 [Acidobacteriota bacterium]|jgi:hypothetical protein
MVLLVIPMRRLALILAFMVGDVAAVTLADREPSTLAESEFSSDVMFAADGDGRLLAYEATGKLFSLWDDEGKSLARCRLAQPSLEGSANVVAVRGDKALVSFFEPAAGQEEARQLAVVDVVQCRLAHTFALEGVVMGAAGFDQGWLTVTRAPGTAVHRFLYLNDRGKVAAEYQLPQALQDALEQEEVPPLARGGRLLGTGRGLARRVVMLATAAYEIWFPAQKGRPARRLDTPDCLAARGRALQGEEAEQELRRRAAGASQETRRVIEDFVLRSRAGRASPMRSYVGAVATASARGDVLVVAVRDPQLAGGCRLDLWDMSVEGLVAVLPPPENICPGFLALGREHLWVLKEGRLVSVPLPAQLVPVEDPCKAVAAVRGEGLPSRQL